MKKVLAIVLFSLLVCSNFLSAQSTDKKYPSKDNYLLSVPILEGCATLDGNIYTDSTKVDGVLGGPAFCTAYRGIVDIAQRMYIDTLLTIKGIAWSGVYSSDYIGFLGIADTDFNIKRRVEVENVSHVFGEVGISQHKVGYSELFFDTAINVKGYFVIMSDFPKPFYPYDTAMFIRENEGQSSCENYFGFNLIYNCDYQDSTWFRYISTKDKCLKSKDKDLGWLKLDTIFPYYYLQGHQFGIGDLGYATISVNGGDTDVVAGAFWFPIFAETDSSLSINDCIGCDSTDYPYINPIDTVQPGNDTIADNDTIGGDTSGLVSAIVDRWTSVYPNPTSDEVDVQCSFKILDIDIADEQGRVLKKQKVDGYHATLDLHDYANGLYIVTVRTKTGISKKKIIKQ